MKQRITALTGSKKVALLESHHSLVLTSTCDMAELVKPGCDAKKTRHSTFQTCYKKIGCIDAVNISRIMTHEKTKINSSWNLQDVPKGWMYFNAFQMQILKILLLTHF